MKKRNQKKKEKAGFDKNGVMALSFGALNIADYLTTKKILSSGGGKIQSRGECERLGRGLRLAYDLASPSSIPHRRRHQRQRGHRSFLLWTFCNLAWAIIDRQPGE